MKRREFLKSIGLTSAISPLVPITSSMGSISLNDSYLQKSEVQIPEDSVEGVYNSLYLIQPPYSMKTPGDTECDTFKLLIEKCCYPTFIYAEDGHPQLKLQSTDNLLFALLSHWQVFFKGEIDYAKFLCISLGDFGDEIVSGKLLTTCYPTSHTFLDGDDEGYEFKFEFNAYNSPYVNSVAKYIVNSWDVGTVSYQHIDVPKLFDRYFRQCRKDIA